MRAWLILLSFCHLSATAQECLWPELVPMVAKVVHRVSSHSGEDQVSHDTVVIDEHFAYYQTEDGIIMHFDHGHFTQMDVELNHVNQHDGNVSHPLLALIQGQKTSDQVLCNQTGNHLVVKAPIQDKTVEFHTIVERNSLKSITYKDEYDEQHELIFQQIKHQPIDKQQWALPTNHNTTFSGAYYES